MQVQPRFVHRVWGRTTLEPWFPNQEKPTGEVWFEAGPLLIKFLFTREPLSVQVHPEDAYAARHENARGKTEMWHILDAEPGARLAAGFARTVTPAQARQAALDGSIEELLQWRHPKPGDTYFIPAGTVHALGGGLTLCEIQQNSDVTYRLYDYNRGRELQLDRGFDVARIQPHAGAHPPNGLELARCPYFVTEKLDLRQPTTTGEGYIIVLAGDGALDGNRFRPGEVWKTDPHTIVRPDSSATVLRTYVPSA